ENMRFHLSYKRLEIRIAHVRRFGPIEREIILREVFVLDEVLDFFQPRWTSVALQLVLEDIQLVAEVVDRNHVAVNVVLQIRDIPLWLRRGLQAYILEMGNRIEREETEKTIGDEVELVAVIAHKSTPE